MITAFWYQRILFKKSLYQNNIKTSFMEYLQFDARNILKIGNIIYSDQYDALVLKNIS